MDFHTFKVGVISVTGLDKDALHIYVGVGIYLLCLLILRPVIKNQNLRALLALFVVIVVALAGEYLDNHHIIRTRGFLALRLVDIKASLHDLINTSLLPFLLFALHKWTRIFQAAAPSKALIKRHKKTDY
ncbi:hypothetical protein J3492_07425 [Psychrobacter sp. F1192]|uniref:VanZ-like domain-containing protein n=1 Tax=Psychrobacter coccoides TaxID=2818440 RepID=A0ABS3NPR5_9GAMM|nr:hypothetical protein [Psychrobacter coccoides]